VLWLLVVAAGALLARSPNGARRAARHAAVGIVAADGVRFVGIGAGAWRGGEAPRAKPRSARSGSFRSA